MESNEKSSLIFPSRGLMLIGIRFYPCDEGDGMSRRAVQCIQKSLYGSKDWFYFNRGFKIIEDENGVITGVDVQSDAFDSSFFLFSEPHKVNISVSAIVGQNGTGKSTIVDNVIRIINNLSASIIGEDFVYSSAQHLHYIDNVYASLAVYQESGIKIVTCKGRKLEVAEFCVEQNDGQLKRYDSEEVFTEHYKQQARQIVLDGTSNSNDVLQPQERLKPILVNWFYTLVGNYSLYAYNYRDYQYEWSPEEKVSKLKREDDKESDYERYCWLKGVFHKNDGYQTPVVIHPMRNNGYIDAHKVNYIGKQNLLSLCFEKRNNEYPFRTINQTHHIVALSFDHSFPHPYKGFESEWLDKRLCPNNPVLRSKLLELENPIKVFWSEHIGVNLPQKDELRTYVHASWDYLVYKTIKVIETYKQYEPLWKKIVSGQFAASLNEDLLELMRDSSHRTQKIRRAVCYLRFCNERDYYMNAGVTVSVDTISDWMASKFGEQIYPQKDYHSIVIEDLLPTPVADVTLQLVDKEHIGAYRHGDKSGNIIPFEGLSSGERQIAYMIANIIYHLKNIESGIHDMNGKQEHVSSIKYHYTNIMLDEVELYFHPDLQRRFIKLLVESISGLDMPQNSGVNITLVTHSPFVLSDIPESNVMFLSRNKGERIDGRTFAANIHDLFNNTFILDNTIGAFAQKQLEELLECYNQVRDNQKSASGWKMITDVYLTERRRHKYAYISQIIGDDYLRGEISDMLSEMSEDSEEIERRS